MSLQLNPFSSLPMEPIFPPQYIRSIVISIQPNLSIQPIHIYSSLVFTFILITPTQPYLLSINLCNLQTIINLLNSWFNTPVQLVLLSPAPAGKEVSPLICRLKNQYKSGLKYVDSISCLDRH